MDRAESIPSQKGCQPYSRPNQPVPPSRYSSSNWPRILIYLPRGRRQTASPQDRAPDDVLRQSADPDLRCLCKKRFGLLMVHHLQNIAPKPKMISRMVDILATMIKPAGPTQKTQQMIQGNAENWGYNTLTILMDQYKEDLDQTLEELDDILIPDWKSAFQFATRWASRSLQRVTPEKMKMPLRPDLVKQPIRGRPMVNSLSMMMPLLDTEEEEELPLFSCPSWTDPLKKLFFFCKPRGAGGDFERGRLPSGKRNTSPTRIDWTPLEDSPV